MEIIKVPILVDERISIPIKVDKYVNGRNGTELKTRFAMSDKITMIPDLANSIGGNSLVKNYSFEKQGVNPHNAESWSGTWSSKPEQPRPITQGVPIWREKVLSKNKNNQYAAGTYSTLYNLGTPPQASSVVSDFISIEAGMRFRLSVDFSVRNGYLVYNSNITPPEPPEFVVIKSNATSEDITIPVPEAIGYEGQEIRSMNIRPIYGVIIHWYSASNTHISSELAFVKRGNTLLNPDLPPVDDELPPPEPVRPPIYLEGGFDTGFSPEIGAPEIGTPDLNPPSVIRPPRFETPGRGSNQVYNPGIWRTFSSVVTSPVNATLAKVEIFSAPIQILETPFKKRVDSKIYFDKVNMQGHGPYLELIMPTEDKALSMDSKSYMTVLSPEVEEETIILEWDTKNAVPLYNVTGCREPLADNRELKFGNEDDNLIWQSWIPFSCDFSSLTGGAKIKKATLVFAAANSTAMIPTNISSIAKGFEAELNITQPDNWDALKGKTIKNLISEPLIHTWVTGEEYEMDVTESAKSLFGRDSIYWGNQGGIWGRAAIILRDSGSTKRVLRSIAGSTHPTYPSPKLKIEYSYNHHDKKALALIVNKERPHLNHGTTSWKNLDVGRKKGGSVDDISRGQLWFDLTSIPSNETIESAELGLYHLSQYSNPNDGSLQGRKFIKKWDWKGSTWAKQFGTKEWSTPGAGEGDVDNTLLFNYNGVFPENDWVRIPIPKSTVDSWRNSPQTNYGIQLRHNSESNGGFFFLGQFYQDVMARPHLKVVTNVTTHFIRDDSDYGAGSEPPETPQDPIKRPVTLIGREYQHKESQGWEYTIQGKQNTNRYLLVFTPYVAKQKFLSNVACSIGTLPEKEMTHICNGRNTLPLQYEVRAQIVAWGLVVPNDVEEGTRVSFSGNIGGGDDGHITLYIMEFTGVDSNNPIYESYGGRDMSATTTTFPSFSLEISPKGQLVTGIALADNRVPLGSLEPNSNQTLLDKRGHVGAKGYLGTAYILNPPETRSVKYNLNWKWNSHPGTPVSGSYPIDTGSHSAVVAVSLNPM